MSKQKEPLFRKLSRREKILLLVFIFVLIEFFLYIILFRNKQNKIYDLKISYNETPEKQEKLIPYEGMEDFSENSITHLLNTTPLEREDISFDKSSDKEFLKINYQIPIDQLTNLISLQKNFGYSKIRLKRQQESDFHVYMEAYQPVQYISYNDIRKAYFQEKETIKNLDDEKIKTSKDDQKVQNSKVLPQQNQKSKTPKAPLPKEKAPIKKKVIEMKSSKINKSTSKPLTDHRDGVLSHNQDVIYPSIEKNIATEVEHMDSAKKIPWEELQISGYHSFTTIQKDPSIAAIYYQSNENDILRIDYPKIMENGSIKVYIPREMTGEFFYLLENDQKYPLLEEIQTEEWNVFFVPKDQKIKGFCYEAPKFFQEENVFFLEGLYETTN
ncbi:MAG: hypothetical protein Q4P25_00630 [Tissierellia bacterium]|nr:hypothetical protein [Tissierellia bacterium]